MLFMVKYKLPTRREQKFTPVRKCGMFKTNEKNAKRRICRIKFYFDIITYIFVTIIIDPIPKMKTCHDASA